MKQLTTFFLVLCVSAIANGAGTIAIFSSSIPSDSVQKDFIKEVYLGRFFFWPGGQKISPIMLDDDHPDAPKTIQDLTGTDINDFMGYWRRQLFSGKGLPPKRVHSAKEILDLVLADSRSVGLVPEGSVETSSIHFIKIQ